MTVKITIADTTPGRCNVEVEFDPPIDNVTPRTAAVELALAVVEFLGESVLSESAEIE